MGKKKFKHKKSTNTNTTPVKSKKSIKDMLLTLAKGIGAMLLIYLIIFVIITIYNYFEMKHHGYDSSKDVINKYMIAMMDNKHSKMNKCLNYDTNNHHEISVMQSSYADVLEQMNITLNKENIEIKESKCENIDMIQKAFSKNVNIENAYTNLVYVTFTETIDKDKFDGLIEFEIITYELNNKWYIFNVKQNEIMTVLAENNEYMTVGNETLGYIELNKQWTPVNAKLLDDTISSIAYMSPNNTAMISLNTIQSKISFDEYIENFKKSLDSNKIKYTIENRTLNGISTKYIYYTVLDENKNQVYQCTWFFERPMQDGYIHCITFDCNDSGKYATNYIEMFHY